MSALPNLPLNALRAFEAAARHLSFTRAGEELGLTQTAVSYQIKMLEQALGVPLFLRRPRQVMLTEAGAELAPRIRIAFDAMFEAISAVGARASETLTIHSTATFAQQWLSRHIGAFQLQHPKIAVRIESSSNTVDFSRETGDVAIRWGKGDWPAMRRHRIMRLDFTPMLSPALAPPGSLAAPADLLALPVVSAGDLWWKQWFETAGADASALDHLPHNQFGTQLIDAGVAVAGQGVAILNPQHFAEDVAANRLYQPFALTCNDGRDYWLVYPESRHNAPKIRAFRDWLLGLLPEIAD
ncbi:LysR substrate-binding domain-containing protein [Rhizobium halophytocola]|uniref:LysR family glycine cleavage system transcriptional activator n=1 Tax=Rhizobium halophytocola TaxID=735519 RepID=A0ABS4DSC8_9HYPH|nr:LysR substrate-binding domain-containing protein [Rhizobium halophytocola]MBP1848591.1 LysR family glycine cleavage system transcriptional activator [Rhizobium halophytocola]